MRAGKVNVGRRRRRMSSLPSAISFFILLLAIIGMMISPNAYGAPVTGEQTPQSSKALERVAAAKAEPFDSKTFLENLGQPSRSVEIPESVEDQSIKKVFKARLLGIESACDVHTSLEIYKLSMGVLLDKRRYQPELRAVSVSLSRLNNSALQGVSPACRSELRGFSAAILRIYLGQNWSPE